MAESRTLTCDQCGTDLSETGYAEDWLIELKSVRIPCASGAVMGMVLGPEIREPTHFCDVPCFKEWVDAVYFA